MLTKQIYLYCQQLGWKTNQIIDILFQYKQIIQYDSFDWISQKDFCIIILFIGMKTNEIDIDETTISPIKMFLKQLQQISLISQDEWNYYTSFLVHFESVVLQLCQFDVFSSPIGNEMKKLKSILEKNGMIIIGKNDEINSIQQ